MCQSGPLRKKTWKTSSASSVKVFQPVAEGDCQFSLHHLLIAFGQQAEELSLEGGLQQAVVLGLM